MTADTAAPEAKPARAGIVQLWAQPVVVVILAAGVLIWAFTGI